jgi:hypothetical protein
MKGLWRTNPGGDTFWPDWVKLADRGVRRFYVPALLRESTGKYVPNYAEISAVYANGVRSHNLEYAPYRDPSWLSTTSATELVTQALEDIQQAGGVVNSYMFDIEYHTPDFVEEVLKKFRAAHRTGPISWTLEPFQGGWFTKNLVAAINNDINCVVVPQAFYSGMQPADNPPYTKLKADITSRGVKANRVKVFYDGARPLPIGWDGCILGEETLR